MIKLKHLMAMTSFGSLFVVIVLKFDSVPTTFKQDVILWLMLFGGFTLFFSLLTEEVIGRY